MFRSKQDIDRHVSGILSKIHDETEKNMRGFNFARLYFQLKDWENAKKYLSWYLSVRPQHAPSHKMMAQIYHLTKDTEKALQSYKRSLEIDPKQNDIILKICELYCVIPVDHDTAKYWADRADNLFPHNDIVFRLRECLVSADREPNSQELEKLITGELAAQPHNLNLQLKLVKLYLDSKRIQEAYAYALKVENKRLFVSSVEWYHLVTEVFEAYQDEFGQELDASFYINFLTALDHLVFLTLAEPHAINHNGQQPISTAATVLSRFDSSLKKASQKDCLRDGSSRFFLHHMKGQLYMHLGSLVIKRARKDQGNWKDACRIASALFLFGYTFKPSNILQEVWFLQMEESQKTFTRFFHEGSMRTSFIGHSIIALCGEEEKGKWLLKIKQEVCLRQVRDRTYHRLFGNTNAKSSITDSYFLSDSSFDDASLEFPSVSSLLEYDKSSYKLQPNVLHNLVWLHLHQKDDGLNSFQEPLHEAFKGLQFSNNNLSRGSPESLCLLDIEAYLMAVFYTTTLYLEQKAALSTKPNGSPLTGPPFIADALCTSEQNSWWRSAYGLVNNKIKERLSDHRRTLQRGLEVIRGIGVHGLEIQLVVHLARIFADKANVLSQERESNRQLENGGVKANLDVASSIEFRATHYWKIALKMLDSLSSNQTIRVPKERMFNSYSKSLSGEEIAALKEEGRLYLACCLMNSEKLEEAAKMLEQLTSPYASYYLSLTYKKLAHQESSASSIRSALLQKARDCLYTTMDRIKGDTMHSLNEDIFIQVEEIDSELAQEMNYANANDSLDVSQEDVIDSSSSLFKNTSKHMTPLGISQRFYSTPKPSPTFLSTRTKHQNHLEPSPERLDAQIRSLAMTQTTLIKTVVELQRSIIDTHKALIEGQKQNTEVVVELKKQLEEFSQSQQMRRNGRGPMRRGSTTKGHGDDEDYVDYENEYLNYYVDNNVDGYQSQHQAYNYNHSRVLNDRTGSSAVNYVAPSGLPSAPPPTMAHYGYQYPPPPHGMPPPAAIPVTPLPENPHYYTTAMRHGLPFSEGQSLPHFHFNVAPTTGKPPVLSNVDPLPPAGSGISVPPPSIVHCPPQIRSPSLWSKPGTVPHAFQIPLPAATVNTVTLQQPTVLSVPAPFMSSPVAVSYNSPVPATASSKPEFFPAPVSSPIVSSGTMNASAVSVTGFSFSNSGTTNNVKPDTNVCNRSRLDSDVYSDTDIEREVMGDFKPVIPLPAEVIVETGEESELVLFEERAKLFRFMDREWKERGIGKVKLLRHEPDGRIRLLMRRDQVLKVCANHYILPSMEINPLKGSDKALTWAAQDFADETVRLEQFCIRFKTADIAVAFKKIFEEAVKSVTEHDIKPPCNTESMSVKPVISPGMALKGQLKPGSWMCPTCLVSNPRTSQTCMACETANPNASHKSLINSTPVSKTLFSAISTQEKIQSPTLNSSGQSVFHDAPASETLSLTRLGSNSSNKALDFSSGKASLTDTSAPPTQKSLFGDFTFSSSSTLKAPAKNQEQPSSKLNVNSDKPKSPFGSFTLKPKSEKSQDVCDIKSVSILGGFTFSATPVVEEELEDLKEREILVVSTKSKDRPQVTKIDPSKSPFSGFSFKSGSFIEEPKGDFKTDSVKFPFASFSFKTNNEASGLSPQKSDKAEGNNETLFGSTNSLFPNSKFSSSAGSSFKKSDSPNGFEADPPLFVTVNKNGRRVSSESSNDCAPEDFVPTAEFQPVIPLPPLVEVKTDEEDTRKLFGESAALFRYDTESKEWKTRGAGELKILKLEGPKYQILMRRDQVLKVCANHYILPEMKLSTLATNEKSWVWMAQDFSDMTLTQEKFAARFKTIAVAQKFYDTFEKCRSELEKHQSDKSSSIHSDSSDKTNSNNTQDSCTGNSKLFTDLFKPAPDSWECQMCYIRNGKAVRFCEACESPKPGTESNACEDKVTNLFNQWECESCHSLNTDVKCKSCGAANKSSDIQSSTSELKPLSELFKSDPSSWECKQCYVKNYKFREECIACEAAKPGTTPKPVTTSSIFGQFEFKNTNSFSSGFVFGSKDIPAQPTFQFGSFASSGTGFTPNITTNNSSVDTVFGGKAVPFGNSFSDIHNSEAAVQSKSISIPPVTAAPTFVFGKPPTTESIGMPIPVSNQQSVNIFGKDNTVKSDQPESPDSVQFKFGSPQKYEFNFSGVRPRSPSKCPKSPRSPGTPTDAEEEDEVEPSDVDNIYFQPVIPLPPKIVVKTGEEDEGVLFSKRSKLFRFADGEWKERGIGDVKILHHQKQNTIRLLMRRDQVLKVCLNHYLTSDIEFTWKGNKSLSWAAADYSEGEPCPEQFAIRFKVPELAVEFSEAIESALKLIGTPKSVKMSPPQNTIDSVKKCLNFGSDQEPSDEGSKESYASKLSSFSFSIPKTKAEPSSSPFSLASCFGTNSPSTSTLLGATSNFFANTTASSSPHSSDVAIVYEAAATPEQVAAAKKLMLPPNFYLYENKPPCPGCIGCRSDDDKGPKASDSLKLETTPKTIASESGTDEDTQALFPNSSLSVFSFAALGGNTSGFGALANSSTSPKAAFPGAGALVFGQANHSTNDEEDQVAENPDIHFEPIIPLPDLVEVKTGEEDEISMFCHRAKLYRFDGPSKQWKERGVGDLKILQHKEKCRFRVLLRRDQVHKVACNHVIADNMELGPMSTSENSLCWSAVDYSEGQPLNSQFAARFKNKDIMMDFKTKFEEATAILSGGASETAASNAALKSLVDEVSSITQDPGEQLVTSLSSLMSSKEDYQNPSQCDSDTEEEHEEQEEDEEVMFSDCVTFDVFNEKQNSFESLGSGQLQVMYDDVVYGYRILVTTDDDTLCDHIIAIQTCLRTELNQKQAFWAAIDVSINPPKRRQFKATFLNHQALIEFNKIFDEGKQIAVEAEIVEKMDNDAIYSSLGK